MSKLNGYLNRPLNGHLNGYFFSYFYLITVVKNFQLRLTQKTKHARMKLQNIDKNGGAKCYE